MAKYSVTETRRSRRVNQASYGASNNRSTLGYWVPLALTVTAATIGLAAWIWSERKEDEAESSSDEQHNSGDRPPAGYTSMSGALPSGSGPGDYQGAPPEGFQGPPPPQGSYQGGSSQPEWQSNRSIGAQSTGIEQIPQNEETGLVARMSSALGMKRAPSPSKAYDWASRNISAGMAAAAATVGGALGYSEDTKEQYEDHHRWNEEAEHRDNVSRGLQRRGTNQEYFSESFSVPRSASVGSQKRKTVVIVVSSIEKNIGDEDVGAHASILASLPEVVDHHTTRVFVLIYAPSLTTHPLSPAATNNKNGGSDSVNGSGRRPSPRQSRASSFSYVASDAGRSTAATPGEFPGELSGDAGILANVDPNPIDESTSSLYKTLHNQAMTLVDRDTMIIPFTSPQGHKHILKSLQPEIVYIQESLCGTEGEIVSEFGGWVRTTVVVIGDEGGLGGLVDTDTEDEGARKAGHTHGEKWWKREERTGVGRGVGVVEALRVNEDWKRRVGGEE